MRREEYPLDAHQCMACGPHVCLPLQDELNAILSQSLSQVDDEAVMAEMAAREDSELQQEMAQLPTVPTKLPEKVRCCSLRSSLLFSRLPPSEELSSPLHPPTLKPCPLFSSLNLFLRL